MDLPKSPSAPSCPPLQHRPLTSTRVCSQTNSRFLLRCKWRNPRNKNICPAPVGLTLRRFPIFTLMHNIAQMLVRLGLDSSLGCALLESGGYGCYSICNFVVCKRTLSYWRLNIMWWPSWCQFVLQPFSTITCWFGGHLASGQSTRQQFTNYGASCRET